MAFVSFRDVRKVYHMGEVEIPAADGVTFTVDAYAAAHAHREEMGAPLPPADRPAHESVLAHCRAHLEDYMVPRSVMILSELPKTSSGKLKRSGLS